jgi:hypothetical protein
LIALVASALTVSACGGDDTDNATPFADQPEVALYYNRLNLLPAGTLAAADAAAANVTTNARKSARSLQATGNDVALALQSLEEAKVPPDVAADQEALATDLQDLSKLLTDAADELGDAGGEVPAGFQEDLQAQVQAVTASARELVTSINVALAQS